jgi:hypothetical protein
LLFDFINAKTTQEILELLFEALRPAKQRIEMKVKKTFAMREIVRLSNEFLINWICESCSGSNDATLIFFQKDTNVRNAMHTLCPVISLKNTNDITKHSILSILSRIYKSQAGVFLKTLDTVDFEINAYIKKSLSIPDIEDEGKVADCGMDIRIADKSVDGLSEIDFENELVELSFDNNDVLNVFFLLTF